MHEPLGYPKVWQSLTKPDGMVKLDGISAVFPYITVAYCLKDSGIFPRCHDGRTPPRKMLRVEDRQKIDVISDASEVEDGHGKQKGEGRIVPLLDVDPIA